MPIAAERISSFLGTTQKVSGDRMSIYDPLRSYLQSCRLESVQLAFAEIESILGRSLPPTARRYVEWWANEDQEKTAHVQCRAWQIAGYNAEVNLAAETVAFRQKKP